MIINTKKKKKKNRKKNEKKCVQFYFFVEMKCWNAGKTDIFRSR